MEPALAEEPGVDEPTVAESEIDGEEIEDVEADPDIVEVTLDDEDGFTTSGGLFDDIDDASDDDKASDDSDDPLGALDSRGEALEDAINDGAARLAVVGIDDDGLEGEFQEVFRAFRLGYFGAEFTEEYIFANDDDAIDPAWGLFGSMICCTAVVLWMRPDGDEQIAKLRNAIDGIGGRR